MSSIQENIDHLKKMFLQNPEDETTRLILTDALEEVGHNPQDVFILRQPGMCTQRFWNNEWCQILWEITTPQYQEVEILRIEVPFPCCGAIPDDNRNQASFFKEGKWWCGPCYHDFHKEKK